MRLNFNQQNEDENRVVKKHEPLSAVRNETMNNNPPVLSQPPTPLFLSLFQFYKLQSIEKISN